MTEGSRSIRDQLLSILKSKPLFKASEPETRLTTTVTRSADPSRQKEAARDDSWKQGVRQLKATASFAPMPAIKANGKSPIRTGPLAKRPVKTTVHKGHRQTPAKNVSDHYRTRVTKTMESARAAVVSYRPPQPTPMVMPQSASTRLSEAMHFRLPAPWVADGCQLQAHHSTPRSLVIRLGVDFGTAFTKMAIGLADKVFLVDWDGIHNGEQRYLLSGEISETINGDAFVGRSPEATSVATDLKLPFLKLERSITDDDIASAATFLSWILKYARAWLFHHHASIVMGNRLIWELNLGAPTGTWAVASNNLRVEYQRLGLTAWRLSQEQHISIRRASALLTQTAAGTSGFGLDALAVLPEFAAQIAGYVRSPQRQDGLHVLADVGAGTLDLACFRVMRDPQTGSDRFPVFASKVEPIGAHFLMRVRELRCGSSPSRWDSTHRVPTTVEYSEKYQVPAARVLAADNQFANMVANAVGSVVSFTRGVMDRTAPEFMAKGVMPVFLAGGGATVAAYQSGITTAFRRLKLQYRFRPFPIDSVSEARFSVDGEACNRLSVARGLTYDADSIGQLIPMSEIPPDKPRNIRKPPGRDELYPK